MHLYLIQIRGGGFTLCDEDGTPLPGVLQTQVMTEADGAQTVTAVLRLHNVPLVCSDRETVH